MDDNKKLEEANKEIERSKVDFGKKKNNEETEDKKEEEGSGIFTADGKELPKIEGGYDIINPGTSFTDNEIVSV